MARNSNITNIGDLREEYEDSLFRYVMAEYSQKLGAELQEENKELQNLGEFNPSPEAIRRFDRVLGKAFRKRRFTDTVRRAYKSMNKAAVLIIAITLTLAITVVSVDAMRVGVLNFLIGFSDEYTSLRLDGARGNNIIGDNVFVSWSGGYIPSFIPEGYSIVNITKTPNIRSILFENEEGKFISYSEYSEDTITNLDTEDATATSVKVNEHDALLIVEDDVTSITWSDGNRTFVIISLLDIEELMKVAESLVPAGQNSP